MCGRTSSTRPVTSTPGMSASLRTAGVGARPMMLSVASGSAWRIFGQDLAAEVGHAVFVRQPVHGAGEDHVRALGAGAIDDGVK